MIGDEVMERGTRSEHDHDEGPTTEEVAGWAVRTGAAAVPGQITAWLRRLRDQGDLDPKDRDLQIEFLDQLAWGALLVRPGPTALFVPPWGADNPLDYLIHVYAPLESAILSYGRGLPTGGPPELMRILEESDPARVYRAYEFDWRLWPPTPVSVMAFATAAAMRLSGMPVEPSDEAGRIYDKFADPLVNYGPHGWPEAQEVRDAAVVAVDEVLARSASVAKDRVRGVPVYWTPVLSGPRAVAYARAVWPRVTTVGLGRVPVPIRVTVDRSEPRGTRQANRHGVTVRAHGLRTVELDRYGNVYGDEPDNERATDENAGGIVPTELYPDAESSLLADMGRAVLAGQPDRYGLVPTDKDHAQYGALYDPADFIAALWERDPTGPAGIIDAALAERAPPLALISLAALGRGGPANARAVPIEVRKWIAAADLRDQCRDVSREGAFPEQSRALEEASLFGVAPTDASTPEALCGEVALAIADAL